MSRVKTMLRLASSLLVAMVFAITTMDTIRPVPSPPGAIDMQNSQVLTTHVELSWEASPGYLDNYLVMLKNCAGDVVAKKSTESTRPTVLLDNPRTGTAYEVVIWAVSDGTISDPTTTIIRLKESNLRVRNLIVKERGTTFVMLEWTRPVYNLVESYEVRWYSVPSKSVQTRKVDPDVTSLRVEDLTPGQLFKFVVTPAVPNQCGDDERVPSEDISVRTLPSPPGAIDMQNSHVLTTRVELSWEASPGYLDIYLVMLKNCAGDVVAKKSTESTRPTVLLDNPRTGTVYEVVIWAVADGTTSDPTTTIIRLKESNLRVRNLIVKERGTTFVMLEWTRPVYSLVESYEVRWYPVQSKSVQTRKVDPDETSVRVEDLTPGQLFKFVVTPAVPNQCGDDELVPSEDISVRTLPSPPGAIDMHTSQVLTTHVELSWEASPGYLDHYLVMLKNCAGDVVAKKSTESTRPTVLLDNPRTGTAYEVAIWAVADGTISDHTTTMIQVQESNLKIRNLIGKERGTTFVMLEWNRPVYNLVESYEVRWYPVHSKSVQTRKVDPDVTSLRVEDLTPGQLIKFVVTPAVPNQCGDAELFPSEDISVRTLPSPPGAIDMQNSQVLTTRVELSWEASPGYLDNYLVMLKNCAGDVVAKKSTESTRPTVLLDNPRTGTAYEVVIWAVADGTTSDPTLKILRVQESNLRIRNLIIKERGTTFVMLEWTRPVYNLVESYEVRWYPVQSKSVQTRKVDPDETSLRVEDLTPGQLFKFIVTPVLLNQCGDEESVQSEDISVRTRSPKPPFIDEEQSYTNSTSIQLTMIKTSGIMTSEVIWKHIIISKTKDKREVVRLESRNGTVLVNKELEANTDYQIEIYVKIGDKRSESQFVSMKTKDVKVSMPCLIGALTGGTIAVGSLIAFGPLMGLIGFGPGGIISGTIAAWLMSLGTISAGSLFAFLQSVGVVGLSITVKAAFLAAGLSIGCMAEVM